MKRKRVFVIMLIVILSLSTGACAFSEPWNKNERALGTKVRKESAERVISLTGYTAFEWDTLYEFRPYLDKGSINNIIGYEFSGLKESVNESMNQIVFMKDGQVVCYVYGYPANKGYGFKLYYGTDEYIKILSSSNPVFSIKIYDKYKLLEYVF